MVISILLFSLSPIVICLQLILLGKLFAIVVSSGWYCSSLDVLVAFPTAFPFLSVPLASNFATQIPVNAVPPKLNPGCTNFVVFVSTLSSVVNVSPFTPSFVFPFTNVTFIFVFSLSTVYAYLGIHTYILPNSSSFTTCSTCTVSDLYFPSLNIILAHFLSL